MLKRCECDLRRCRCGWQRRPGLCHRCGQYMWTEKEEKGRLIPERLDGIVIRLDRSKVGQ